jgi:hypothetical protein
MNEEKVHEADSSDPIPNTEKKADETQPTIEPSSSETEDPAFAEQCKRSLIYGIVSDICNTTLFPVGWTQSSQLSTAGRIFLLTFLLAGAATGVVFGILGVKLGSLLRKDGVGRAGYITSLVGLIMNAITISSILLVVLFALVGVRNY